MLQMNLSTENYRFLAKNKNVAQIFPMIIQIYTHKKYSIRIDTKKLIAIQRFLTHFLILLVDIKMIKN